ncbi:hypothetical protein OM2255_10650 [alpha proteobacterium HTCC2255]|nr:hypothetical protein OM2255_10650 [alpha proteobacterium HTCC2255] [Rhodobacterales bacterium HTCC2255]
MPVAFIVFANFARNLLSTIIIFPVWQPAMLKVLVAAVIITNRSDISGAAFCITVCLEPKVIS